ncbi:GNAT family N-acetyltransferase [Arachidicoccus soli]|uniref:N-acetyltransferase n=1 Tax=Arachidicoccus soli TaxID=2341117 RepID=A0A386HNT4_9BACT|nr:GNAT family protein [Arachidicoccus soli]AYD47256.1 N-acetyltransferase [Arachidicoccus soli]
MQFDFLKDYILEDERVLLRPFASDDIANLRQLSLTEEPALWKYSQLSASGEENLKNYVTAILDNRANKTQYAFIIFDKLKQEFAGSTRFYNIDLAFDNLFLGYTFYGSKFQGTGLNKHAKFLLFQFAFEEIGVERIEMRAHRLNERSIAAMKSIGCTVEGVLRKNVPATDGGRRDSVVLSILKEEWLNGGREMLQKKLQ